MKIWWLAPIFIVSCSISTPFEGKPLSEAERDKIFYVAITHAQLRKDRKHRSLFWQYVDAVEKTLVTQEGFLGFSKRTRILGNDAWTMTVWSDEKYIDKFSKSPTHQEAVNEAYKSLAGVRFARLRVTGDAIPVSWSAALDALDQQNP